MSVYYSIDHSEFMVLQLNEAIQYTLKKMHLFHQECFVANTPSFSGLLCLNLPFDINSNDLQMMS